MHLNHSDPASIQSAALAHIRTQAALGHHVGPADAVNFVLRTHRAPVSEPLPRLVRFLAAPVHFHASAPGKAKRAFRGVAYGGGIILDHPAHDAVVFDLAVTTFTTPAPLLFNHGEPIGVVTSASLTGRIEITGALFADLDGSAQQVAAMADRGLPWQLSVGIWPDRIDQVARGDRVTMNGRTLEGPFALYRGNRVREVSIVALGADDKTRAEVLSEI